MRHFGTGAELSQETLAPKALSVIRHFDTRLRHFCTESRKSRDTPDSRQFEQDTAPPVIRLEVDSRVSKCISAEVSNQNGQCHNAHFGPGPEVSGHFGPILWSQSVLV